MHIRRLRLRLLGVVDRHVCELSHHGEERANTESDAKDRLHKATRVNIKAIHSRCRVLYAWQVPKADWARIASLFYSFGLILL
jgi:hypothetical protein